MPRRHRIGLSLMAATLFLSGCYGPFNLTRRLYQWNGSVGTKWEREFMFILLAWAPVYGLAVLGDALVFNSMEFWTGKNPVDPPSTRSELPKAKRIVRGSHEALLTYLSASTGARLLIEQMREGRPAGSLRVERQGRASIGFDAGGRVLFTAETLADGSVLVRDGSGKEVALYSVDQVEQFVTAAHRVVSE